MTIPMQNSLLFKTSNIVMAIAIALLFVNLTGIATFYEWYSPDLNYRLQTEAFFRGGLAIQHHPYEHGYDWVWGNGMHQNWGLGVPFLRFPFEILSHVTGVDGFPDRLVFIVFFVLAALVFAWGIKSVRDETDSNDLSVNLESWFITMVCFISPTFIAMAVTRFDVYEEAVAYNCLWALGLGGLLLRFCNRPNLYLFLIVCFLSGFSPMIRPTGIFYGCITVGLAVFMVIKSKMSFRYLFLGLLLFGVFPVIQLFTNYLRFGEFFEFGYHRILDMIPVLGFMLKFNYPFADESFFKAARELFGSLFLVKSLNGLDFFQDHMHSWQADALRFREYYFPGFSLLILGTTIIGWILGVASNRFKLPALKLSGKAKQTFWVIGLWSIGSFFILFLFYLKKPAFSSRYVIDFLPALAMGTSIFLFTGTNLLKRVLPGIWGNIVLAVLIVVWISGNVLYANVIDEQRPDAYKPPSAITLVEVDLMYPDKPETRPDLPTVYGPDFTKSNYNIPSNLWGWYCYPEQNARLDSRLLGLAGPVVTLYFRPFECIEVKIKEWRPDIVYDIDAIQVKAGTQLLSREAMKETDGTHTLTFCSREPDSIDKEWNMVTLGLARVDQVGPKFIAPFRLVSVKALSKK